MTNVVFAVALAAVLASAERPAPFSILPSMVKVRPGAPVPMGEDALRLALARNECEGAQLLVREPGSYTLRVVAPRAPRGARLPVKVYREAFVDVATPSNSQGAAGPWPDALLPAAEEANASTAERPLVYYVELCADSRHTAGTYGGQLVLQRVRGPSWKIPIEARVRPFALPKTSSLPNAFGLSLYSMARGHGLDPASPQAQALLRQYVDALLRHRLSPYGLTMSGPPAAVRDGKVQVDFAPWEKQWADYLGGEGDRARFTTAQLHDAPRDFDDEARAAYFRAVRDRFAARGWKARLYFYAKDEPRPEDYPLVLTQAARVKKAGGIPVLITSPLDDAFKDAAGILSPVMNCFFPRPGPQTCKRPMRIDALRAALPEHTEVWWYQSCMSHGCGGGPAEDGEVERAFSGWASYMIDHPAALNRAMGPLAFLAGVDGELYWDTVYAYNTKPDPWRDLFEYGGNGDGTLFYPGTPKRLGGVSHQPIESLRLKHIRDGLEDYEYLRLLALSGDEALARRAVAKLTRSGYEITEDPATWAAVREEVAQAIERRGKYPGASSVHPDR